MTKIKSKINNKIKSNHNYDSEDSEDSENSENLEYLENSEDSEIPYESSSYDEKMKNLQKKTRDKIHYLLSHGTAKELNKAYFDRSPLLGLASQHNMIDCVKLLLNDDRVDPNAYDIDKCWTCFHYSIGFDVDIEIFMLFLECPRTSLTIRTNLKETPLMLTCNGEWNDKNAQIISILLDDPRIDPNDIDNCGDTFFHHLAGHKVGKELILKILDDPRINIQIKNNIGDTPFMIACMYNNVEFVKLLLNEPRIDPNARNNNGETAFFQACKYLRKNVINLLIDDSRIDPNIPDKNGITPFCIMIIGMKKYHTNNKNERDEHYEKVMSIINILKNNNVDINKVDNNGLSPIDHMMKDVIDDIKFAIKTFGKDGVYKCFDQ